MYKLMNVDIIHTCETTTKIEIMNPSLSEVSMWSLCYVSIHILIFDPHPRETITYFHIKGVILFVLFYYLFIYFGSGFFYSV